MSAPNHPGPRRPMDCCAEYERAAGLSRRRFLAGMAAATSAAVVSTTFGDAFRQTAFGAGTGGNVLVVLSPARRHRRARHGRPARRPGVLRGPAQHRAAEGQPGRGRLDVRAAPADVPAGRGCGTPGELAAVHAVGLPVPNRSHFSAMEEVEDADPGSTVRRGWINRMIGQDGVDEPSEAVQLGTSIVPTELYGPAPALAAGRLSDISLVGADANIWGQRRRTELDRMWSGDRDARARRCLPVGDPHRRPARADRRRRLRADQRASPTRRAWPGARPVERAAGHRPADQGRPRHQRGGDRLRVLGHALGLRHDRVGRHAER